VNIYFDKYHFESNPNILTAIAHHLAPLVPDDISVSPGLKLGGIPVVTASSFKTGLHNSLTKNP